jgi:putative phosphoribosyl transferase
MMTRQNHERKVIITDYKLEGDLVIPSAAKGVILFAHGSGSGRHSTRNQHVAQILNDAGFATLLIDLLTHQEKQIDEKSRHLRFDVDLLARRFESITNWLVQEPETCSLDVGYFGSSTGAAAALIAASGLGDVVKAIVCRGGRVDLADAKRVLQGIKACTFLIVGGKDAPIIEMNRRALAQLTNARAKELAVIPDATHLFEEAGKMDQVAGIAAEWFESYLLGDGTKFENKYRAMTSGIFSLFKEKPHIQIRFKDRPAAGEVLVSLLKKYNKNSSEVIVIGIPRGGVIVADVVARRLGSYFDIVIPRKLRAPTNSENAIGAIMQDGSVYLDNNSMEALSHEYIEAEKMEQKKEIDRRMALYRPEPKEYNIQDKTTIIVDDGAATGATIIVAARWLRKQNPRKLIIAAPVASPKAMQMFRREFDHVEIILSPSNFTAVEHSYRDFRPVSDEKVIELVRSR